MWKQEPEPGQLVALWETARYYAGIAGDKSAMLIFGGGPGQTAVTESYNGSTWTEVNDLNTARDQIRGCGTQTAALGVAGNVHPVLQALTEKMEWYVMD